MRYSLLFVLLGASVAALGLATGGAWLLLLWPALSFVLVGAAYLAHRPAWLGKRRDGTRAAWAYLPFGPYLGLAFLVSRGERLFSREDPSNEVAPGLWVGRLPAPSEVPAAVRVILDLTAELTVSAELRRHPGYRCEPTLDGEAPADATLKRLVEQLGAAVLVHCASGHGRSATVAAGLLLARGLAQDVARAEAKLRERRPGIRLAATQRSALARVLGVPERGPRSGRLPERAPSGYPRPRGP